MADTAVIASSGRDYLGNAALGNGGALAISIDQRPIEQLAQYTYLYNRSQYQQRQIDADEKIKALGALAPYDLVNGRGKDKQAVIDAQAALTNYMAEFASKGTPKSPKEKIQQDLDFQTKIKDTLKIINGANTRAIGYTVQKNEIDNNATLDAKQKDNLTKDLDEQFDKTDIYTPISPLPKFDLTVPKVAAPILKDTDIVVEGANGTVTTNVKFFDPQSNLSAAFLEANNLELPTLPPNATDLEKKEYKQKLLTKSDNKIWQDAATVYNTALTDPKYQKTDADGKITIDYQAIEADNPILHNTLALIDRYNAYSQDRKADATNGFYLDKVGNKVQLINTVKPSDFFTIDKEKPLSPSQIVFLQKFAAAAPDKKDEKYQYTGKDNAKLNTLLDYKVAWRNANKPPGSERKAAEVIDKPAILFGQHIDRLKSTFAKNGNQEIVVQYKAVDDKTRLAAKLQQGDEIVYKPDGNYEIKDSKGKTKSVGTIENLAQGFIDAVKTIDTAGKDKDGTMAEGFQLKSENYFKQLWGTTSGKLIWDNWGGQQTSPATVEAATTAVTKKNEPLSTDAADWKQEGNNWRYKDGTLYDSNGKIIKK